MAVMPEALMVVDSLATVTYASPAARRFGIIEDQAMTLAEIRDILRLVSTDSVVRERELTIPLHEPHATGVENTNGKGVEAGKPLPKTRCICTCASDRSPTIYLRFSFRI